MYTKHDDVCVTFLSFSLSFSLQDFRSAVEEAVGADGEPVVEEGRMDEILSTLPQAYQLHTNILTQLDSRIQQWWDPTGHINIHAFNPFKISLCWWKKNVSELQSYWENMKCKEILRIQGCCLVLIQHFIHTSIFPSGIKKKKKPCWKYWHPVFTVESSSLAPIMSEDSLSSLFSSISRSLGQLFQ